MAAWHEPPKGEPSHWRTLDTWPTWAWVAVILIEVAVALLALKYG